MSPTKKMQIAVIPGDGTGPEVTAEALKVLQAVASLEGFQYETKEFDFGGPVGVCATTILTQFAEAIDGRGG